MGAKPPKRMEMHKDSDQKPKVEPPSLQVKYRAKSVPDFAKEHEKFAKKLEAKRQDFKGTEPAAFKLGEGKKSAAKARTWMNKQNDPDSRWKGLGTWDPERKEKEDEKARMKITGSFQRKYNKEVEEPKVAMTRSAILLKENTKKWDQAFRDKQYQKEKEEQDRKDKYEKMKHIVQGNPSIVDNSKKLKEAKDEKLKADRKA